MTSSSVYNGKAGACRGAATIVIVRLLFLQPAGVRQQDLHQIGGPPGRVHGAVEAVAAQPRQVAGVVDVGVGEDHVLDRARVDGQRIPVAAAAP
jgi:hypothetical protein